MSLSISDYGYKTHSGKQSTWFAAHSPCVVTFQRKDASSGSVGSGGVLAVTVPEDVFDEAVVGDLCYINTADGAYDGIFEITSMVDSGGGVYTLFFNSGANRKAQWAYDISELNHATDTYLNLLKRDYVVELEILRRDLTEFEQEQFTNDGGDWDSFGGFTAGDNIGRTSLTDYRFKFSTPPNGTLKVDLSEIMTTFIDLQYLEDSQVDVNVPSDWATSVQPNKMSVILKYRQNWSALPPVSGSEGELNRFTIDSENPLHFINAVRQSDTEFGPNLAEYVLHDANGFGKFLTPFDEPTFFVGYPFWLSFITSTEFAGGKDYKAVIREYDKNGTQLTITIVEPAFTLWPYEMHHLDLAAMYSSIHASVDYITVSLDFVVDESTTSFRMPAKKIKVRRDCVTPSKAVIWKNRLGGESIWVFPYNQEVVSDNRNKTSRLTVYQEHLTENEWDCLQDIANGGDIKVDAFVSLLDEYDTPIKGRKQRTGTYVFVYDPSATYKLKNAVVDKQQYERVTRASRFGISFTFEYKETYIQQ